MTFLKKYYPLLLILVLASVLRVHLLLVRGTFWFDEIFSVHFSSLPWKEALRYWLIETNPPFYTFFLRFWLKIAPVSNELLVHLPSLIAGLASIALLYYFAQKFFSKRAAIASALFFALSDITIFLNTEARGYSFLIFFAILSFFLYFEIFFNNKKTRGWWITYFLTNALLLSTHLTALSVPFGQALCLILLKPDKTDLKKWWSGHTIIGLFWLYWFVPSIIAKIDPSSTTAWFFSSDTEANSGNIAILLISLFFTSFHKLPFIIFAAAILAWLVFQYARNFKDLNFEQKKQRMVLAVWAFLLPITGAMAGVLTVKFYVLSAPALYLIAGEGLTAGTAKYAKNFWLALAAAGLFLLPSAMLTSTEATFSWRIFTNYIEQNETPESLIIITPFNEELSLNHYYHGQTPIAGLYLRDDNFTLDERIVRYNWNRQVTDKRKLEEWVEKKIAGRKKIFYIQYTEEYDWVHQILKKHGWKLYQKGKPSRFINICLFEFREN
ncbi:glycosyltransferase family 39 protein [Candidatus Peregrinibacteria bacterium]|nr:glycosyltransferase family 39 protein [Candidatus Peregrinibacteria bacterium]